MKSAQEDIKKWVREGMTLEQAVKKWESIMHAKLPEIILNTIKEVKE